MSPSRSRPGRFVPIPGAERLAVSSYHRGHHDMTTLDERLWAKWLAARKRLATEEDQLARDICSLMGRREMTEGEPERYEIFKWVRALPRFKSVRDRLNGCP